jgi:hypothetical protein
MKSLAHLTNRVEGLSGGSGVKEQPTRRGGLFRISNELKEEYESN